MKNEDRRGLREKRKLGKSREVNGQASITALRKQECN